MQKFPNFSAEYSAPESIINQNIIIRCWELSKKVTFQVCSHKKYQESAKVPKEVITDRRTEDINDELFCEQTIESL